MSCCSPPPVCPATRPAWPWHSAPSISARSRPRPGGRGRRRNVRGLLHHRRPQHQNGFAFLDSTLVVAGDLANVKAAIDRRAGGPTIPTALVAQVNQLSSAEDAWAISTVPPSTLRPSAAGSPAAGPNVQNALQKIESASGGVKFGSVVVVTGQAQAATPQDASSLGDVMKLFVNMAQMSAAQHPRRQRWRSRWWLPRRAAP